MRLTKHYLQGIQGYLETPLGDVNTRAYLAQEADRARYLARCARLDDNFKRAKQLNAFAQHIFKRLIETAPKRL
jgi:hypothetical protein